MECDMTSTIGIRFGIGLDAAKPDLFRDQTGPDGLLQRLDESADFLTLEDGFARPGGDGLDAILFANWLGARTRHAGIIAGAAINFLEPFHVSTAIATLDYVTEGRAGLFAQSLKGDHAAAARRAAGALNGYPSDDRNALERDFDEAVDVIRRLWDSWEDDAVIRDRESQRFVDGAKLRYVDFKGANFSVLGPSITPRPPQGQPVIAASIGHGDDTALLASVDLAFLHASDSELLPLLRKIKSQHPDLLAFADVGIGTVADSSASNALPQWNADIESAIAITKEWAAAGLDGIRFLPGVPERDLEPLITHILPALAAAGLSGTRHGATLRERLALPAAANRHAVAAA
jgi:alkanesulfonate monooxygenase SsuD/methylene tetrahydromethanopterin reductase-like flavin-dependent oxidoreductase (luciferase family)